MWIFANLNDWAYQGNEGNEPETLGEGLKERRMEYVRRRAKLEGQEMIDLGRAALLVLYLIEQHAGCFPATLGVSILLYFSARPPRLSRAPDMLRETIKMTGFRRNYNLKLRVFGWRFHGDQRPEKPVRFCRAPACPVLHGE